MINPDRLPDGVHETYGEQACFYARPIDCPTGYPIDYSTSDPTATRQRPDSDPTAT